MIKILRRLIFFLFLAVFLIGAPKIIFYALGYSYQSGTETGLVKTGLVYLSTTPPGATVYVGGRRYREPTPAIIRDLLPGTYPIRLVLNDHDVWTRAVPVEAAKASVLGKILLHPKKPAWHLRVPGRFEEMIAIPETRYLLLRKSNQLSSIEVYDWKDKKSSPLFASEAEKKPRFSGVYFIPGSTHVLFEAEEQGKTKWAWLDLNQNDREELVWSEIFPEKPDEIKWSAKDPRYLFAFNKGNLSRFDTEKMTLTPVADNIRGYGVDERKLFVLSQENNFFSTDFLDKNRKPLLNDSNLFQSLFGQKGFFEVRRLTDDVTFFLSRSGRLITNQRSPLAEKGVLDFQFDKKHRKAIVWTQAEIGTAEFSKERNKTDSLKQGAKIDWILKQAHSIRRAFWAHDGAYIIFQDQNKVLLLELETFGAPAIYELLECKSDSAVFYSDESGELFYLDKKTADLMSLEVIPKWKVLEIPFSILQEKEKEGKVTA